MKILRFIKINSNIIIFIIIEDWKLLINVIGNMELHINVHKCKAQNKVFWWSCSTPGNAGFADFVYRPVFQVLVNTTFWKLDLLPSSGEERES
jgi:hypothetical protein